MKHIEKVLLVIAKREDAEQVTHAFTQFVAVFALAATLIWGRG